MTFSGRFSFNLMEYAARNGADLHELIALSGFSIEELFQEETRLDAAVFDKILQSAMEQTGDPQFGLHAGENMNLASAGLIGQITQISSTVKEALAYCCEFASLGCRVLPMSLKEHEKGLMLIYEPDPKWEQKYNTAAQQTIEGYSVFFVHQFHLLTVRQFYPLEVGFTRGYPRNVKEYERVFKSPVKFKQENNYILFENAHATAKIKTSNYQLLQQLVQYAEAQLTLLKKEMGFVNKVKETVFKLMSSGFPKIEDVAGNMNTSVRTLQRKLSHENTSFQKLLESVKQELAEHYLQKSDLSLKEVAALLGYSEPAAFTRSFKQWTGSTPSQFQQSV